MPNLQSNTYSHSHKQLTNALHYIILNSFNISVISHQSQILKIHFNADGPEMSMISIIHDFCIQSKNYFMEFGNILNDFPPYIYVHTAVFRFEKTNSLVECSMKYEVHKYEAIGWVNSCKYSSCWNRCFWINHFFRRVKSAKTQASNWIPSSKASSLPQSCVLCVHFIGIDIIQSDTYYIWIKFKNKSLFIFKFRDRSRVQIKYCIFQILNDFISNY